MATEHPDYGKLAARLSVRRLHERTASSLAETYLALDGEVDEATGEPCRLLDDGFRAALEGDEAFVRRVEAAVRHERDLESLDYFGFKTLEKSYLLKHRGGASGSGVAERPQHLLMRVALGIHRGWETGENLELALETYELMSERYLIHASPTLFHAGAASGAPRDEPPSGAFFRVTSTSGVGWATDHMECVSREPTLFTQDRRKRDGAASLRVAPPGDAPSRRRFLQLSR